MPDSIDFSEVFNDSFEAINRNPSRFYKLFYGSFTSSSYLIKNSFKNTEMTIQQDMLNQAILIMVAFFVSKKATVELIELAEKHENMAISSEMYDIFVHSFLTALSQFYPGFSNKCAIAWRITLSPGIEFMKHYRDLK